MAQNYNFNDKNSTVSFSIKNIGINVNGTFTGLKGVVIFNYNDLNSSKIDVSVNSNSVNTENAARDKHLRKEEYFDVEKFPLIFFSTTKIEATKRINRYTVEGNLTIKGITKPIKLELLVNDTDPNRVLKCNFEINRRTFKIGGNSLVLSDTVKLNLNIICNKS